jgi:rare lipoprotein A
MDFNVLSTQNWSRMFNVWVEDIQVVCLPVVTAPSDLQHCFLRKVRTVARYTSLFVIFLFSLHCTRPRPLTTGGPRTMSLGEDWATPADVFTESGQASWYGGEGDGFAGRPTASGERYDPTAPTCAHRTLPFGTLVEVENTQTGLRTMVRVNDRGPFVRGRILDVSRKAAGDLGMLKAGVAPIRMRSVDPMGRPAPLDPAALREDPYTIQVAALSDPANIERLSKELRGSFGAVTIQNGPVRNGSEVKRIRVGSYTRLEEAQEAADQIANFFKDRGVEPFITRQR